MGDDGTDLFLFVAWEVVRLVTVLAVVFGDLLKQGSG